MLLPEIDDSLVKLSSLPSFWMTTSAARRFSSTGHWACSRRSNSASGPPRRKPVQPNLGDSRPSARHRKWGPTGLEQNGGIEDHRGFALCTALVAKAV